MCQGQITIPHPADPRVRAPRMCGPAERHGSRCRRQKGKRAKEKPCCCRDVQCAASRRAKMRWVCRLGRQGADGTKCGLSAAKKARSPVSSSLRARPVRCIWSCLDSFSPLLDHNIKKSQPLRRGYSPVFGPSLIHSRTAACLSCSAHVLRPNRSARPFFGRLVSSQGAVVAVGGFLIICLKRKSPGHARPARLGPSCSQPCPGAELYCGTVLCVVLTTHDYGT